jgi:antitoxin component YwqK of YwqJK toxin-antitoxin module
MFNHENVNGRYTLDDRSNLNGACVTYYADGSVNTACYIYDDVRHGEYIEFFEHDGGVFKHAIYVDDSNIHYKFKGKLTISDNERMYLAMTHGTGFLLTKEMLEPRTTSHSTTG